MDAYKNFSYSVVATAPSPALSGTALTVAAGDGARFPAVPFNVTVWPIGTQPLASNAEIVRVTNGAGDVFTIQRTQEGTSARAIVAGDQIAATITAKTLTDLEPAFGPQAATYPLIGPASGSDAAPTFRALLATDIPALPYEASGAIAIHAALTTGVHGLAITAGQTLTVTTGGTLGSAAYTAASAYDASGLAAAVAGNLSTHAGLTTTAHGLGASAFHADAYFQAASAKLTTIAGLSDAAGNFIVGSAGGWVAQSGATARTSLGLGTTDSPQFTALTTTALAALTTAAESWIGPSSTTGVYFKGSYVGVGRVPDAKLDVLNNINPTGNGQYNVGVIGETDTTNSAYANYQSIGVQGTSRYRGSASESASQKGARAFDGSMFVYNTGTTQYASGFRLDMRNLSTGTVQNFAGAWIPNVQNTGGGVIDAVYGLRVDAQDAGTANYGAWLNLSAAAGRWNVYALGTAPNYFAGNVGVGLTPTAVLTLKAGTATANTAPLQFAAGTNETTARAGVMEYDGTNLFFTRAGTVREYVSVAVSGVAAPSTSVGVAIVNYFGASATNFLGTPNAWESVNYGGTVYKRPLYT